MARGFVFPSYTRDLPAEVRQAVAEKAARDLEAHLRRDLPAEAWDKRSADMMLTMGCHNAVALRWAVDRIAALEAALAKQTDA